MCWTVGPTMGGWMIAWMVVFWGAVAVAMAWGIRRLVVSRATSGHGPLDIAGKRYARGEITRDEYEKIKEALNR